MKARVMGDFRSIVGEGSTNKFIRSFGFDKRNRRSTMLIKFFRQDSLVVIKKWLKKKKRQQYTWKSPETRNTNKSIIFLWSNNSGKLVVQET